MRRKTTFAVGVLVTTTGKRTTAAAVATKATNLRGTVGLYYVDARSKAEALRFAQRFAQLERMGQIGRLALAERVVLCELWRAPATIRQLARSLRWSVPRVDRIVHWLRIRELVVLSGKGDSQLCAAFPRSPQRAKGAAR